jgi:hypothetical protein
MRKDRPHDFARRAFLAPRHPRFSFLDLLIPVLISVLLSLQARALLEQALTEAQLTQTGLVKTLTGKEALGKDGEITQVEEESEAQAESSDKDDADVCSICFERLCNIEVG